MGDDPPYVYNLYGCPHDCGWVGEKLELERVSDGIYRCPTCNREVRI